jgi:hypothetical protein
VYLVLDTIAYVLVETRSDKEKGFAKCAETDFHFDNNLDWVPTRMTAGCAADSSKALWKIGF